MALELDGVEAWLYSTLSGDAALTALVADRCYPYHAPQQAVFPFVVFALQTSFDVGSASGFRGATESLYLVKAVSQTQAFETLAPIVVRVDALLHRAKFVGVAGGVNVLGCEREQAVRYAEVSDGVEYRHAGAMYRVWHQAA